MTTIIKTAWTLCRSMLAWVLFQYLRPVCSLPSCRPADLISCYGTWIGSGIRRLNSNKTNKNKNNNNDNNNNNQNVMPPFLRRRHSFTSTTAAAVDHISSNIHSSNTSMLMVSTPPACRSKKRQRSSDLVTPEPLPSICPLSTVSGDFKVLTPAEETTSPKFWDLKVPPQELRPSSTLTTGQCFVWKDVTRDTEEEDENEKNFAGKASNKGMNKKVSAWGSHNAKEWIGTLRVTTGSANSGDSIVLHIKETPETTLYRVVDHFSPSPEPATAARMTMPMPMPMPQSFYEEFLRDYFQLSTLLQPLYQEWSTQCPRMRHIAQSIPGVRILRQDPWECLISFICSSNNNIPRITSMLQSIRKTYGRRITGDHYTFPTPLELSTATENDLRSVCGLGYRAKYIVQTTLKVLGWGGESALVHLRGDEYSQVHAKLSELAGVGPKVADCVALFSLDQDTQAIPVDVHVWNICMRDYAANDEVLSSSGAKRSLTPNLYKRVQQTFRNQFPTKTAWAHSLLFVAELPSFRPALPVHITQEMDEFKQQEQEKKKLIKKLKP